MSKDVVTSCAFLEGNGHLIAVIERALPRLSRGFYQLRANPEYFEIHGSNGDKIAKFPMPNQLLFESLTHLSQIAVVECPDGIWEDCITNAMYVQTFQGAQA